MPGSSLTWPRARHRHSGRWRRRPDLGKHRSELAQSSLGWRGVVWIMAVAMAVCTIVPALFLIRNTPADVGSVPYGAGTAQVTAGVTPGDPQALPGFTYKQAPRNSSFWIACVSFLILA